MARRRSDDAEGDERRGGGVTTPGLRTVAALFVREGGCYFDLPGVDPWGESRDARRYAWPHPVVAHPPCGRWCQLARLNESRWGAKVGDDGGCFESAVHSVRRWGGVLEHPAFSLAWDAFSLPKPTAAAGWFRAIGDPGWSCEVSQAAYGHAARKLTWLYYVGAAPPPPLLWARPRAKAWVSKCANHGDSGLRRLVRAESLSTPPSFRDCLVAMARGAGGPP